MYIFIVQIYEIGGSMYVEIGIYTDSIGSVLYGRIFYTSRTLTAHLYNLEFAHFALDRMPNVLVKCSQPQPVQL